MHEVRKQSVWHPDENDPQHFDPRSGSLLEHMIFNHRAWFILLCAVMTGVMGYYASTLRVTASYKDTLPQSSPYVQNFLKYKKQLPELGNLVRIVVTTKEGTIYNAHYLKVLHKVYNQLYTIPGIFQPGILSLWSPGVRYVTVTKKGYAGGPVMPTQYDGSAQSLALLRNHINTAGLAGRLVGNDLQSSMLVLPLLEINPKTGEPLDYQQFSHELENKIRPIGGENIQVHIAGFAKLQGDLIDGVTQVLGYFALAVFITALIIFLYNRCARSTLVLLACSIIAVVWELGLTKLLGYNLDPYSVLVPFLVFAIGLSHGSQKMNGIMQDIGRGASKYVASRYTFRRIFLAGLTALLADAVGFDVQIGRAHV